LISTEAYLGLKKILSSPQINNTMSKEYKEGEICCVQWQIIPNKRIFREVFGAAVHITTNVASLLSGDFLFETPIAYWRIKKFHVERGVENKTGK
jgi:hypothetical protein